MHCPTVCRISRTPHKGTIKNIGVNESPFHQDTFILTTCDPPANSVHSLYCHDLSKIQLYPSPPQPPLGSSHHYLLHGPVQSSSTWFPGSSLHPVCSPDGACELLSQILSFCSRTFHGSLVTPNKSLSPPHGSRGPDDLPLIPHDSSLLWPLLPSLRSLS